MPAISSCRKKGMPATGKDRACFSRPEALNKDSVFFIRTIRPSS
jgi:hypothetical protein